MGEISEGIDNEGRNAIRDLGIFGKKAVIFRVYEMTMREVEDDEVTVWDQCCV